MFGESRNCDPFPSWNKRHFVLNLPTPSLCPVQPPIQWTLVGVSLEIKQPGRESDRLHLLVSSGPTPATFHTHLSRARQYSVLYLLTAPSVSLSIRLRAKRCLPNSWTTRRMCKTMALWREGVHQLQKLCADSRGVLANVGAVCLFSLYDSQ